MRFLILLIIYYVVGSHAIDQFNFKMDWNPSSCGDEPCLEPLKTFNAFTFDIMLATEYQSGGNELQGPCVEKSTAVSDIAALPSDLTKALSCIYASNGGSDQELWQDAWLQGSCTGLSAEGYFRLVVDSYEKFNPNKMMYDLGIAPPTVDRDTFLAQLEQTFGVKAWVECDGATKKFEKTVFCLSPYPPHAAMDCPWSTTDPTRNNGLACDGPLTLPLAPPSYGQIPSSCSTYIPYTYKGPTTSISPPPLQGIPPPAPINTISPPSPALPNIVPPAPTPVNGTVSSETGSAAGSDSVNIGVIVGAVVGGLAVVAAIVAGFLLIRHRKKKAELENDLTQYNGGTPYNPTVTPPYVYRQSGVDPRYATSPPVDDINSRAYASQIRSLENGQQLNSYPVTNVSPSASGNTSVPSTPISPTSPVNSRLGSRSAVATDPLLQYINSTISNNSQRVRGNLAAWELRYEDIQVECPIGEGSFGRVYKARWNQTQVAVKVLLDGEPGNESSLLQASSPIMKRLEQEASLMSNLHHPNVVQFLGICTVPAAIVTEYCARGSLHGVLRAGATSPEMASELSWSRRIRMAADAARGMIYLHSHSPPILHRDMKSANLLVTASWVVKVTDFNLSKILEESTRSTSMQAMNPRWLAPEVLNGGQATLASDVYSYGVVLWELLTWQLPWGTANPWSIVSNITSGSRLPFPPPAELPGAGSGDWPKLGEYVALLQRCWAQEPSERPSFQEIMYQLRTIDPQATEM